MACGDCATVIKRGYLVDKKGGLLVCLYIFVLMIAIDRSSLVSVLGNILFCECCDELMML